MKIEEKIDEIRLKLEYHNKKYYIEDLPEITDYEYDRLYRELEKLEELRPDLITIDSPTQRVGGKALEKFEKVNHNIPMQSLADAFDYKELDEFDKRVKESLNEDYEYIVEKKIDGLSVSLEYKDGSFFRGSTRGDGLIGEDVTLNIKTIKSIPLKLKDNLQNLEVRGEVFISKDNFIKINEEQEALEQDKFKNPRNAAAGSLRQLDSKIVSKRKLDIYLFNIQNVEGKLFEKHDETLIYLNELGFKVSPEYKKCKDIESVKREIENIGKIRNKFSYEIDGAVVKVNNLNQRIMLGSTSKNPKWAIAYKYPAEQKITKVEDIYINVGRTGVLTPNALLTPVNLAGTTVSRATLHNFDFIQNKNLKIGDIVIVQKAGDIIPEVVEVLINKRTGEEKEYNIPKKCPKCGSDVMRKEGEVAYRCIENKCPAKLLRNIIHFVSRDAMNIEGLGSSIVNTLLNENLIKNISDLYILKDKRDKLIELERFGEKSVNNLLNSIDNSKNNNLDRLIFGFGIRHIGLRAAKLLSERFKNIDEIINANKDEFENIEEYGSKMAESLVNFFNDEENMIIINNLKSYGLNMESHVEIKTKQGKFDGKIFVLTGILEKYTRNEAQTIIEKYSGKVSKTISKKTSYLIAGKNSGSKLDKANKTGVKILDEKSFEELLLND
ncbi:MAG: NAD-dependent DNA ligase LigA [Clostridiales bacterium]